MWRHSACVLEQSWQGQDTRSEQGSNGLGGIERRYIGHGDGPTGAMIAGAEISAQTLVTEATFTTRLAIRD